MRERWSKCWQPVARGLPIRLVAAFLAIVLSVVVVGYFERAANGDNMIWIANGLILAILLLAPRWRWGAYLTASAAGLVVGSSLTHESWFENILFNVADLLEVLLAALLVKPRSVDLPQFTHGRYLLRFAFFCIFLGPLASGTLVAILLWIVRHNTIPTAIALWILSDGLGIAVMAPTCAAILRDRHRDKAEWSARFGYLFLVILVTIGVFSFSRASLLFLVYPLLVLLLVRTSLGWSALGVLCVAILGGAFTIHGFGPLLLIQPHHLLTGGLIMQFFVAASIFMLYAISVVLEKQRSTELRLSKIAALHQVVTENSRDAIVLVNMSGERTYVSQGITQIAGWTPEEMLKMKFPEPVHPLDAGELEMMQRAVRAGSMGGALEYRMRRKDGSYIWVEASLRVYRDPKTNLPLGFLKLLRDIGERKVAEQRLQDAYRAVEALAVVDSLTGIANRRRFDATLMTEWRRGLRDNSEISLLFIDVDLFKQYNDLYGHVRGDSCLKQIAEAALDVILRPADLVARYGGEEFAVILPGTGSAGACRIAEEICEAVRARMLRHEASDFGIVTISIGFSTIVPQRGKTTEALVDAADRALYAAKRLGRNRVVEAGKNPAPGEGSDPSGQPALQAD